MIKIEVDHQRRLDRPTEVEIRFYLNGAYLAFISLEAEDAEDFLQSVRDGEVYIGKTAAHFTAMIDSDDGSTIKGRLILKRPDETGA